MKDCEQYRDIGNIELPEPKEGEFVNYVLDFQQRITSFCSVKRRNNCS